MRPCEPQSQRFRGWRVPWVEPCLGWTLHTFDELDGDGFWAPVWFAVSGGSDVLLRACRFAFTPTQERFDWLVRNGFPRPPRGGPWDDCAIDEAIVAGKAA